MDVEMLAQERGKRKRAEDDYTAAREKLARMSSAVGLDSDTKEQLESYQKLLNCSVCKRRPKAVVVTRCGHMACHECVQAQLGSRARRCVVCNQSCSQSDVYDVYF